MENLIFSLSATMPVFPIMVLGFFLRKIGWVSESFASQMNKFVFRLPLPVMVFHQLAVQDFAASWDTKFVLFCFGATLLSILIVTGLSKLVVGERGRRGEFIQASYRSSAALLGIAYITNIYGSAGMVGLMIIGAVPLYNIMAVVVLTVTDPTGNGKVSRETIVKTLKGIVTNPIIVGIVAGLAWSLCKIPMGVILEKTFKNIANLASPLGLIAMGASIEPEKIRGELRPAFVAAFVKLLGLCAIFLPMAVALGFREEKLVAILVMLGSATTVSSFVMAKNMGHEGTLTSNTVVLTTILASFSLTFWIWVTRSLGLI